MNILIVGGAGEVGKYLIKDLVQRGHTVRSLEMARQGLNDAISMCYHDMTKPE